MKRLPRMTDWLIVAIVLSLCILAFSPQQIPVSLYKINLISIAGVVGYWLDRSLFPYARPDTFIGTEQEEIDEPLCFSHECYLQNDMLLAASMLRRSLIVAAAMIAVGLGA